MKAAENLVGGDLDNRAPLLDLLGTLAGTNFNGDLNAAMT